MTPEKQRARLGLFAVATLLALAPFGAVATTIATLTPRTLSLPIGGLQLPVPLTGDLHYRIRDGQADIDGRLAADLAEVQQRAKVVLAALLDYKQPCGDQMAVRDGHFGARSAALVVIATIDYGRMACIAGQQMKIVPRALYDIEMLLHPVVSARSLRMRAEVLALRKRGGDLPTALVGPMQQMLGNLVGERIGDLFPSAAPPELSLKSLNFQEAQPGRLAAEVYASGIIPQTTLERLVDRR